MAKTILVIDDAPSIHALMRLLLAQAGRQAFDAADGRNACALLPEALQRLCPTP